MKIYQPYSIHELGRRKNQEDSIFPVKGEATTDDRTFIVCDGMGGHDSGEVASSTVCDSFAAHMKECDPETFDVDKFKAILVSVAETVKQVGVNTNMGTTLTFLHLNDKGALVAHIGDSRVYHIRRGANGKMYIVHRTTDHSFVGELVLAGVITEEEARNHPKKNVITRAIQARDFSPAEFYVTSEVYTDDYFFLCTDGVIESIEDYTLLEILSEDTTDEAKMEMIRETCLNSADNNSAYLVRIAEGVAAPPIIPQEPATTKPTAQAQSVKSAPQQPAATTPAPKAKSNVNMWLVTIIVALLAMIITYIVMDKMGEKKADSQELVTPEIVEEGAADDVPEVEVVTPEPAVPEVEPVEVEPVVSGRKPAPTTPRRTESQPQPSRQSAATPPATTTPEPASPAIDNSKSNDNTPASDPSTSGSPAEPTGVDGVVRDAFNQSGTSGLLGGAKAAGGDKAGGDASVPADGGSKTEGSSKTGSGSEVVGTDV